MVTGEGAPGSFSFSVASGTLGQTGEGAPGSFTARRRDRGSETAERAKESAARKAKESVARRELERRRLDELERLRQQRIAERKALTIKQTIELRKLKGKITDWRKRIKSAEEIRFATLPKEEQSKLIRELLEERRVEDILKRKPGAKLDPRHEAARKRIERRETEKKLFIEERVVDTFRRGGKEIQVTKTVIVDERGRVVRDATAEESKIVRRAGEALRVPEELKVVRGEKIIADIEREATRLRQKRLRGKADVKGELALAGLTVAGTVVGAGMAITQLPKLPAAVVFTIKRYVKDPASIKEIPEAIGRGGAEFGYLMKISPTEAIVRVGSEYLVMKGMGKALKITGKLTSVASTKVANALKGVKVTKRAIFIPHLQKGKALTIRISSKVGRGSIPKQLTFAGKKTTAVSAQADRLVNFIKTRKIIRKPIRGEEKLTKITKKLLKKFDDGKITAKELINLDKRIRVEAKKGLLERSFFADPEGVVRKRFLRLGTEKEASLLDTLAGDVTFKTSKPQILIFKDVKVQAFPKTKIFKSIINKLETGKVLTQKEAGKLLKFQLKATGKLKPLGFQTSELEVTGSPTDIIKKVKTVTHVIIDGKRVSIVLAKLEKAKPATAKLLSKAKKGTITANELKTLRKNLKKETGFTSSISDSRISRPKLPLGRKAVSVAIRATRRRAVRRPPKRIPKRVPKRKVVRRPPKRVPRRPPKRVPVRKPVAKPPVRRKALPVKRPTKPPVRPPIVPPSKKVIKQIKKPVIRSYHVYARPLKKKGKRTPKLIRITKKPIIKTKAKDLRNYIADTSLSRTALIKGSTQKPAKRLIKAPAGYHQRTQKKFRKYKTIKKRKVPLRSGKVIERSRYLLDTKQEKKKITLKKRVAQLQKQSRSPARRNPTKRTSVSRKTPVRMPQRSRTMVRTPRKTIKRNPVNSNIRRPQVRKPQRPMPTKRKPSQAQLDALAKGRRILEERRNKK